MKVLTIQRSKWRRGGDGSGLVTDYGYTSLLNDKGLMCCLGFDALACGLREDEIRGQADPAALADNERLEIYDDYRATRTDSRVERDMEDDYEYTIYELTKPASDAVSHNDEPGLSDGERERLIAEDLKALGWDRVEFVD